jgi:hypothetical protein
MQIGLIGWQNQSCWLELGDYGPLADLASVTGLLTFAWNGNGQYGTSAIVHRAPATPSFFCRLVDDVVYWNTSRLPGKQY